MAEEYTVNFNLLLVLLAFNGSITELFVLSTTNTSPPSDAFLTKNASVSVFSITWVPWTISSKANVVPSPSTFKSPVIVMSPFIVPPEDILAAVVVIKAIYPPKLEQFWLLHQNFLFFPLLNKLYCLIL